LKKNRRERIYQPKNLEPDEGERTACSVHCRLKKKPKVNACSKEGDFKEKKVFNLGP